MWLILDESVKVEKLRGEDLNAWHAAIDKRIRDQGVTLWPYIGIAKQSEFDEDDEEDEDDE